MKINTVENIKVTTSAGEEPRLPNTIEDHNRHARIQQMFWDTEGNPYFGKPGQTLDPSQQKVKATVVVN